MPEVREDEAREHHGYPRDTNGLFAEVFETIEEMDAAVMAFARKLATSNPEALSLLKKVFWEGTEHWNELLLERAGMSGKLVLSDFTREALAKFGIKA